MMTGMRDGREYVCPLYASRDGNRTAPGTAAGRGRFENMEGRGREAASFSRSEAQSIGQKPANGTLHPKAMGYPDSSGSRVSVGDRDARRCAEHHSRGYRPRTVANARAAILTVVGALVFAAGLRQAETWHMHEGLTATVLPGISPDDPIVTFKIGQR